VNWYGFFGNFTFMMLYTFLGRCFEFFVGIKLALIMLDKRLHQYNNNFKYTYVGFLLIFVFVAVMATLPTHRLGSRPAAPVGYSAE
jgi:hypothetical protein